MCKFLYKFCIAKAVLSSRPHILILVATKIFSITYVCFKFQSYLMGRDCDFCEISKFRNHKILFNPIKKFFHMAFLSWSKIFYNCLQLIEHLQLLPLLDLRVCCPLLKRVRSIYFGLDIDAGSEIFFKVQLLSNYL